MNFDRLFRAGFLSLVGSLALVQIGCGDDEKKSNGDDDSGAGGASDGSGGKGAGGKVVGAGGKGSGGKGSGGASEEGGDTIFVSGTMHSWNKDDPFDAPALAGVEVCLHGSDQPCVTSASDGTFSLPGVPKNSKVVITMKAEGRVPYARIVETKEVGITIQPFENGMALISEVDSFLPGIEIDLEKGGIVFFVNGPGTRFIGVFDWVRGATVTMTPKSGDGPLYLDETHTLAPDATETVGGWGHFVNMDPGTYELKFTVPDGYTCTEWADQVYGYPTGEALTLEVPVIAGFSSYPIGFFCNPPAPGDGGADAGTDGGDGGADASSPDASADASPVDAGADG
jgi:hypothetical protein